MANVSGGRVWGKLRLGLVDGLKMALGSRGMLVEAAQKTGRIGEPWCLCRWLSLITQAFLHCPAFFRTALRRSGGLSPGEGWDAVTRCGWSKLSKGCNY